MAMFIRAKRVSDPLDDEAKARLRGVTGGSSGSEHGADPLFPGLIHDFLQISSSSSSVADNNAIEFSDNDNENEHIDDSDSYVSDDARIRVRDLLDPSRRSDPFLVRLHDDAVRAAEASVGPARIRAVMTCLRESGYNAGLCKARWESRGSLTAGSYEYVDVIVNGEEEEEEKKERYIVDVDFVSEFSVARTTKEYGELLEEIPRVMVGRKEEVREVVRMMAGAAKRCMKSSGLHVPPWRKRRFMLAKWLGPYRRTTNSQQQSNSAVPVTAVRCVAVGFNMDDEYVRLVGG